MEFIKVQTLNYLVKRCYIITGLFFLISTAKADHITGGEMFYTSAPGANGTIIYSFTLKLFMRCNSGRTFNDPAIISFFNRATNKRTSNLNVALTSQETIRLSDAGPCVTNPPVVCYVIGTYRFDVALAPSPDGYLLSSQVNFRIAGITNMASGYSNIGATYTCEIPGFNQGVSAPKNNSARFTGNDLVVVCASNRFSYSFGATDPDGDVLRYSFCSAYVSGSSSVGNNSVPPPDPPYSSIPYGQAFGGNSPLGSQVQIDTKTGLITGIAPPTGIYVVTVCVEEIREGVVIATQRKDLQINIAACDIAAAALEPEYQLCRTSTTLNIQNLSNSVLIRTQNWQITNQLGKVLIDTTGAVLQHTFTDTGIYNIKLVINRTQSCSDSTFSLVRVYPGFIPAFRFTGICFQKPTSFFDQTTTRYGAVKSLEWDFGDIEGAADNSTLSSPVYTYATMGSKVALLTATNTNGCRDTANRLIPVVDKPPVKLAFADTLICVSDSVQFFSGASGIVKWSPATNILNANTQTPTVFPSSTTKYYIDLDDQGCLNRDSITVRVTDHVNLLVMPDTTICSGDATQLKIFSDAFKYSWSPAANITDPFVANPIVTTVNNTSYEVTANIGSCVAKNKIRVTTVPYPIVNAGADTMLCFNTAGQLMGTTNGLTYKWAPAAFVSNSNILNPVAFPPKTTTFTLSAFDNKGCPKPGIDSVEIAVLPDMSAFAGNDTTIVVGQDLHLNASGGTGYNWTPTIGLSSAIIANPIARFNEPSDGLRYTLYAYNQAGCVDTASFFLKVYATLPSVFVPTAFTPNADGLNDVLRPIAAGIKQLEYFSVFNRWGNLLFTTKQNLKGWDGTLNSKPQATGTYVWVVKAIDYKGSPYLQRGTVTLIR